MIESGQLVLDSSTDPADIGYITFPEATTGPQPGSGELHMTACHVVLDERRRAIRTGLVDPLLGTLLGVAVEQAGDTAPQVFYRHCGRRRCMNCDHVFFNRTPTRMQRLARRWRSALVRLRVKPTRWR